MVCGRREVVQLGTDEIVEGLTIISLGTIRPHLSLTAAYKYDGRLCKR